MVNCRGKISSRSLTIFGIIVSSTISTKTYKRIEPKKANNTKKVRGKFINFFIVLFNFKEVSANSET